MCFSDRNKIDFAFNKCTDKDDDIRPSHLPCFCGDCLLTQMAYSHEPSLHVLKDSSLSVHLKMDYRIQCKGDFTMPSLRLVQAYSSKETPFISYLYSKSKSYRQE